MSLYNISTKEAQAVVDRLKGTKKNLVFLAKTEDQVASSSSSNMEKDILELKDRLSKASKRIKTAQESRAETNKKRRELTLLRDSLYSKVNELQGIAEESEAENTTLKEDNRKIAINLEKYMQVNVLNDAFYIWYSGPYATINNFRIGNLGIKVLEWLEINTALGQAALALTVVAQRLPKSKFLFTKYQLYPMGSQSKVFKVTDSMMKSMYHSSVNKRMASIHRHAKDGSLLYGTGKSIDEGGVETVSQKASVLGPGEYSVLTSDGADSSSNNSAESSYSRGNYSYNFHFDRYNSDHFPHYTQTHTSNRQPITRSTAGGYSTSHLAGDATSSMFYPVQALPTEAVLLNLFMDTNQTFSLFPRSKFNSALYGLFCCIYELGEYVRRHDPPLSMPYIIDIGDGSGRSCTIIPTNPPNKLAEEPLDLLWHGSIPTPVSQNTSSSSSLLLGSAASTTANTADEKWTRALKFAFADIKWIIAWSTKHFVCDSIQS
jgi:hypothetical protein